MQGPGRWVEVQEGMGDKKIRAVVAKRGSGKHSWEVVIVY